MSFPFLLDWEITSACNFRCKFCHLVKEKEVSNNELLRYAEHIQESPFFEIKIGGGEPLLRKEILFEIAKKLSKKKSLVLVTNGYLIEEKDIKDIKDNFNRVQISLYAFKESLFEGMSNYKGSYSKIMNNIQLLIKHDVPLIINFVITNENMGEIESVHSFVGKNNLKLRLIRYRGENPPAEEDLKNIYDKYGHFEDITFDDGFSFYKNGSVCGAIENVLAISSDGSVYPCTWMRDPLFKLGNIGDSSLKSILNNEKTKKIRKTLAEISVCSSEACPFFKKDECLKTIKDY